MGNGSSSELEMDERSGVKLLTQGEEDVWTLHLQRGPEGEGEGVCVFSRKPGKGAQAELCKAAVEVRSERAIWWPEQCMCSWHCSFTGLSFIHWALVRVPHS